MAGGDGGGAEHFREIAARERGLERRLSARQMSMIAIGGAIGTGLFLGSRFAIGMAGPAVLLSYGIGGVITLLVMGCLAEMTVAHPVTGSFGAWAEFYVSPMAGFLVRAAYWAGVVLALGTEVQAVAVTMRYWVRGVPDAVWIVGFGALLVGVNAGSVRVFGVVETGLSAVKVGAICGFVVLGAVVLGRMGLRAGWHNVVGDGGFFARGAWGMWEAVLLALFSYFSIEMIAIAAGEAEEPRRAITQAFRATMVRLLLFYGLTLLLVLLLVPWRLTAAGATQSPFVTVMERMRVPWAAGVLNGVVLLAALSAMNSQLYITARMLFSLSRAGMAPRGLGRLSGRGVPVRALLVSTAGIGVAAVLTAVWPARAFLLMVAMASFGPLFTWLMVFVTHLRFRRRRRGEELQFRMWGAPWTTGLGLVLLGAAMGTTLWMEAFRPTLLVGVPFMGVLAVVYKAGIEERVQREEW